jgi:uncharacterized damage-inducible protein DinB
MLSSELVILNLEEVRRRSLLVWREIPSDRLDWAPDAEAMSCIELVRHVVEGEFLYKEMLKSRRSVDDNISPFQGIPLTTIEHEIESAALHRAELLRLIRSLTPEMLDTVQIDRTDQGYIRSMGDFILRIAYHEAVHTGQLLSYLRMMGVPRPQIWD